MESVFAFSSFDLIAYLMVGLAMFMVLDMVLGLGFLYRPAWNTGSVTGILIFAYLAGHLISIPSRTLFEGWARDDCLGTPSYYLLDRAFEKKKTPSLASSLICDVLVRPIVRSEYFDAATPDVLDRIKRKHVNDRNYLFNNALVVAHHDAKADELITVFQRLSLLFRNMAFLAVAALVAVMARPILRDFGVQLGNRQLVYFGVRPWMLNGWVQLLVFLALAIGLFDRYLFYSRLYALEAITAFAYAPSPIFD